MSALFPFLMAFGALGVLIPFLIALRVSRRDSVVDLDRLEQMARIWAMFRHPKLVLQPRAEPVVSVPRRIEHGGHRAGGVDQ